jgi:hypothetical protein
MFLVLVSDQWLIQAVILKLMRLKCLSGNLCADLRDKMATVDGSVVIDLQGEFHGIAA